MADPGYHPDSALYSVGDAEEPLPDGNATTQPDSSAANATFFNDHVWCFPDTYNTGAFFPDEDWSINQNAPPLGQAQATPQPPQSSDVFVDSAPEIPAIPTPASPPSAPAETRPPPMNAILTPAQRQKLQQIAMPSQMQFHSPPKSDSSPGSTAYKASSVSSPDEPTGQFGSRKRKSSAEDDDEDDELGEAHPIKKTAHNMIEKRYRTNLNDKIAALRDSVPSLRIMSKSARGEDTTGDREELHGLTPAHKLNKATVLSKATEYIRHLEKRNAQLMAEQLKMQQRIGAFEKLYLAGSMNGTMTPSTHQSQAFPQHQQHQPQAPQPYQQYPPTPVQRPQDATGFAPSPIESTGPSNAPGMIRVPDEMKRIIAAQSAVSQHYQVPQQPSFNSNPAMVRRQQIHHHQQQQQASGWQNAGPYFGKLMVGSLAGLMLMEAVHENERSNDNPDGRGLFALPVQLLNFLRSSLTINMAGYSIHGSEVIYYIRIALLICGLWWALLPTLSRNNQHAKIVEQRKNASPEASPSLASPIHVRRQAWLTAIQNVWVPRHNFVLELAALGLKTLKLSLRSIIGIHGYQLLTGLTPEQEVARVQAWAIALDAQLAGGDVEISKSRLTLTLLASGTLPSTPLRLMLKALHIRVLLWRLGSAGGHCGIVNTIASKLARNQWNSAQHLHRLYTKLRRVGHDVPESDLPDHLAALLEQDCDQVFNPSIVQRAHNLAWNRPTDMNSIGTTDGMDNVVDDMAVRSPMDAVAAWWSSMTLQEALTTSFLVNDKQEPEKATLAEEGVSLAIRTAPIGSVSQNRALVARAIVFQEKKGMNIVAALQAIGPVTPSLSPSLGSETEDRYTTIPQSPSVKEIPSSVMMATELRVSLLCAMAVAHLEKYAPPEEPQDIYGLINQIQPTTDMGLLGFTAAFALMDSLAAHPPAANACTDTLERLSGTLRIWTGKASGLDMDARHQMIDRCLAVTRGVVGMEFDSDTGYGSMSESDGDTDQPDTPCVEDIEFDKTQISNPKPIEQST